jgi:acetoin utilization deacetylase AcuC-like enzyme
MPLLTGLIAAHGEGAVQELACLGRDRTEKTIESVEACFSGTADSLKLPLKSVRRAVELLSDGNPSQPWEKDMMRRTQFAASLG